MSTIKLSPKAIEKLTTELKQTSGFSLSVEFHSETKMVLEDMSENAISDYFKKHKELLEKLPVSSLDSLKSL